MLIRILFFLCLPAILMAAKVLFMPTTLHPSHPYIMSHLANELSKKGHQISWLEYAPKQSDVKLHESVKRVFLETAFGDSKLNSLYIDRTHPHHSKIWESSYEATNERTTAWMAGTRLCDNMLAKHKKRFDGLVKQEFDTIVVDDEANPCGLLLAGLKGSTFVYWSLTALRPESAWAHQSPNPPSYVPVPGTKLTDDLSFAQRSFNMAAYLRSLYVHQHIVQPRIDAVFQKHYPGAPSAFDLERNASINFVNTPPIFDFARPFMPRVNFVGGLHCKKPSDVRGQLGIFVDEANEKQGFILFTSGLETDWSKSSPFIRDTFISAFQAHPETRFVWQYNGPEIENLPVNVFVAPHVPQQDLLGHKKCRAHITTGGINSVVESVWHGKPVIGFPLTVEGYDNLLRITARGAGIMVTKEELQLSVVKNAVNEIYDPKYLEEMEVFQDMVRDVPYTELTHASFWVEFIERHGEVPHARSGADKLNALQYFLVDIILFLFSCIVLISGLLLYTIMGIFRLLRGAFRRLTGRNQPGASVTNKKKNN